MKADDTGTIILLGSICGTVAGTGPGVYSASKAALAALAANAAPKEGSGTAPPSTPSFTRTTSRAPGALVSPGSSATPQRVEAGRQRFVLDVPF